MLGEIAILVAVIGVAAYIFYRRKNDSADTTGKNGKPGGGTSKGTKKKKEKTIKPD